MENLKGRTFGRLTVTDFAGYASDGKPKWRALCLCGRAAVFRAANLKSNSTTSCGCLRDEMLAARTRTHGLSKTGLYSSWRAMHERCENPKHPCYSAYGGRGISVCPEWGTFEGFLAAMGEGYAAGLTLDRIDPDCGYHPGNCRWVSLEENRREKRNTLYVVFRGNRVSLRSLARRFNLDFSKVYYRFRKGYNLDQCLFDGDLR